MAKGGGLVLGVIWPAVVAAVGRVVVSNGSTVSDASVPVLFLLSLGGVPPIWYAFDRWLPRSWPAEPRAVVAMVPTAPVFVAGLFLAVWVLALGAE